MPNMMRTTRTGASLVELLAALTVAGLFGAVLTRALDRAARLHVGTTLLTDQRTQLHGAAALLRELVAEASSPAGAVISAADSAIIVAGSVGSSVACVASPAALDLPPEILASGQHLTFWTTPPQSGDSVLLYDAGPLPGPTDDRWQSYEVASIQSLPNACQGTPWVDPVGDAGKAGWRLTTATPVANAAPGSPLRLLRPQRLAPYTSAPHTMLGFAEWDQPRARWQTIQPVAGPLITLASSPPPLSVSATDSLGVATTNLQAIAALHVRVRGPTQGAVRIDGRARGIRTDSADLSLALRNRQ